MSQGKSVSDRVLHWLTTRPFKAEEDINELVWIIWDLEHNDWSGKDEDGEDIVWDGMNMATCTRDDPDWWDDGEECSSHKRTEIIAQDLSLMHVYFKQTHIRKYLKEQNFGTVEAIGSYKYLSTNKKSKYRYQNFHAEIIY